MRLRHLLPGVAPAAAVVVALLVVGYGPGAQPGDRPPHSCAVAYRVVDEWNGGFSTAVTVTNTGDAAINGWALTWTFPNGQSALDVRGAVASSRGDTVTVRSTPSNAPLRPTASARFGFTGATGTHNGAPELFTLNGVTCSLA